MNFKPGDRVRIIGPTDSQWLGREATILRVCSGANFVRPTGREYRVGRHYDVAVDGQGTHGYGGYQIAFEPHDLAPLTPPAADAWATEQVKRITKPLHVEPVVKEKARV